MASSAWFLARPDIFNTATIVTDYLPYLSLAIKMLTGSAMIRRSAGKNQFDAERLSHSLSLD
ncbi:hypothetical Protein YC6258_01848 [Gynuella sunshinyii YC6258]|uniref:Uncharacterized protein n=1 Tax=Gynuella sunshinyii YC6258 TaxID=1445510 RepID=A0A0C5VH01_9GAMM|nr:hypothetical Protein YC6258_01848 [Gynuella sunshinyii YC6258]